MAKLVAIVCKSSLFSFSFGFIARPETDACPFRLAVLMYFIAIMPMGKRTRTSKDGPIGC